MENFIDYAKQREKDFTKVNQAENDLITYEVMREYYDDWVKLNMHIVGSSLPKVCTGCGSLNTEVIDKKYLACCPDNNYVPLEEYLKNSRYTKYTKFKR